MVKLSKEQARRLAALGRRACGHKVPSVDACLDALEATLSHAADGAASTARLTAANACGCAASGDTDGIENGRQDGCTNGRDGPSRGHTTEQKAGKQRRHSEAGVKCTEHLPAELMQPEEQAAGVYLANFRVHSLGCPAEGTAFQEVRRPLCLLLLLVACVSTFCAKLAQNRGAAGVCVVGPLDQETAADRSRLCMYSLGESSLRTRAPCC